MELILGIFAALVTIQLVTPLYYLWMKREGRRADSAASSGPLPGLSVILATYNEASTIARRLENLAAQDYPPSEVIVIDSGSVDGTGDLVRAFQAKRPDFPVVLVEEPERTGKVVAMRKARPLAKGEVVAFTDADCLWEPNALRTAAARFSDPRVGAVTGMQVLMDGEGLAEEVERGYNGFYNTLRIGESGLDSTPVFRGEMTLVRRDLLARTDLGDEAPAADDSEIAMKIRKLGYRAVVEPRARFREFAPPTLRARRVQKARRGAGLLQLFLHNLPVALRPSRYGWFSVICAANVLILLVAPLATAALAVVAPFALWRIGGPALLLAGAAAAVAGVALARAFPRSPASLAVSYLQSHAALLSALPLVKRRDPRWAQITEVRDRWRRYDGT